MKYRTGSCSFRSSTVTVCSFGEPKLYQWTRGRIPELSDASGFWCYVRVFPQHLHVRLCQTLHPHKPPQPLRSLLRSRRVPVTSSGDLRPHFRPRNAGHEPVNDIAWKKNRCA